MSQFFFFTEDIDFELSEKDTLVNWLQQVVHSESKSVETINYIFCSDKYLLDINTRYLNHDFYTDIITFDNSENPNTLSADIFVSIERVRENATIENTSFQAELTRVLVHGVLHLLGYKDKTEDEAKSMRQKEDHCLSLLSQ